jgi:hypothetical protein
VRICQVMFDSVHSCATPVGAACLSRCVRRFPAFRSQTFSGVCSAPGAAQPPPPPNLRTYRPAPGGGWPTASKRALANDNRAALRNRTPDLFFADRWFSTVLRGIASVCVSLPARLGRAPPWGKVLRVGAVWAHGGGGRLGRGFRGSSLVRWCPSVSLPDGGHSWRFGNRRLLLRARGLDS